MGQPHVAPQRTMSLERLRLVGGELQGQVMWLASETPDLDIHMSGLLPGAKRVLHYRRSGAVLRFVGETLTPPATAGKETT